MRLSPAACWLRGISFGGRCSELSADDYPHPGPSAVMHTAQCKQLPTHSLYANLYAGLKEFTKMRQIKTHDAASARPDNPCLYKTPAILRHL